MQARFFYIAMTFAIAGCAAGSAQMQSAPRTAPAFNLSGVWEGETRVIPCLTFNTPMGRCNAVNRITFVIRQEGSTVSGDYKCAIGTVVCRDANQTTSGEIISGTLTGSTLAMRVMISADISSCIYNGEVSSSGMNGSYRCYQGGGLQEVGMWQVSRASDEPAPKH